MVDIQLGFQYAFGGGERGGVVVAEVNCQTPVRNSKIFRRGTLKNKKNIKNIKLNFGGFCK